MSTLLNRVYEFGEFSGGTAERVVWRSEEQIRLTPKVFYTLLLPGKRGLWCGRKTSTLPLNFARST
jgi:hypothetical protein